MEVDFDKKRPGYELVPNPWYKAVNIPNRSQDSKSNWSDFVEKYCNEAYDEGRYPLKGINARRALYCDTVFNLIRDGKKMSILLWQDFENFIAELWAKKKWKSFQSIRSRNGGINIILKRYFRRIGLIKFICLTKKYAPHRPVGVKIVREFIGQIKKNKATKGIIFTTSRFTKGALKLLSENESILSYFDGDMLEAEIKLQMVS